MYKKAALLAFLVLLLISGLAAAPAASKEEVRIAPWMDEVTIGPNQIGVLRWGWGNCTKGLTNDWIEATVQHHVLRQGDEVIQVIEQKDAQKYWGVIEQVQGYEGFCIWPAASTWNVFWRFEKLKLNKAGEYQLDTYVEITQALIDGFDYDEDGQADWYEGVMIENTVTIYVE